MSKVPAGWGVKPLEELALIERGKFSVRPRNDPRYYGGHIPFVQTGDVTNSGTYLYNFSQTLNDDGLKVSKLFPKGTILITIAANIGDTTITTFDTACPDSVVAIQPYKNTTNVLWLKFFLETQKDNLDAQSTQNAQKNINLQVLRPLSVLTPPLSEQTKIAQILTIWDKAIATTEQLIGNSQQQKKALMQSLLTGKKRLPGFEGELVNSTLEDACYINPKKASRPEGGLVSFISMDSVSEDAKLIRTDVRNYDDVEKGFTSFSTSDVLVAKITPCFENGKGAYLDELKNGVGFGSTEFHVLRAKKNTHSKFIYYVTNTDEFRIRGEANMQGSAGQKRVTTVYLKQFPLKLPPLPEQQKIAQILTAADNEIELLQKKLAFLKQEKTALMQQLLTGKRRVKVEAA